MWTRSARSRTRSSTSRAASWSSAMTAGSSTASRRTCWCSKATARSGGSRATTSRTRTRCGRKRAPTGSRTASSTARSCVRDPRGSPGLGYWTGVAGGLIFALVFGVFAQREALVHQTDFSGYWAGGRALLAGADPYDSATWRSTTAALGTQPPDTSVYGYFPWVALAMVPLALLPLEAAAWLWCIASIVVASLGVATLLRARPCPPAAQLAIGFALFGSQPAVTAFVVGQWSPMLTGGLAFAVAALDRGRIARAVPALLLALAKPQPFPLTIPVPALRH